MKIDAKFILMSVCAALTLTSLSASIVVANHGSVSLWRRSVNGSWYYAGMMPDTKNYHPVIDTDSWITSDWPVVCLAECNGDDVRSIYRASWIDAETVKTMGIDTYGCLMPAFSIDDSRRFVQDYRAYGPRIVGTVFVVK